MLCCNKWGLIVVIMEEDYDERLFSDVVENIYLKLRQHIQRELQTNPYAIVRIRWLKKLLQGRRGIQFIIKRLSREYDVTKMGSWYVVRPKTNKSKTKK